MLNGKVLPRCGRKKAPSDSITFSLSPFLVFVSPANNDESENNDVKTALASENIDTGKSILRALPKLDKKENKNPRAKKGNNQKPKQKKMEVDSGFTTRSCCCFVEWLITYSN